MITKQTYFKTKDGLVGFEVTVWEKGTRTVVFETRNKQGTISRFQWNLPPDLEEEGYLFAMTEGIRFCKTTAASVL